MLHHGAAHQARRTTPRAGHMSLCAQGAGGARCRLPVGDARRGAEIRAGGRQEPGPHREEAAQDPRPLCREGVRGAPPPRSGWGNPTAGSTGATGPRGVAKPGASSATRM